MSDNLVALRVRAWSLAAFGDVFAGIGVREPQANASEAFTQFGEAHREVERFAIKMLQTVKPVSTEPMVHDVSPPLHRSVPIFLCNFVCTLRLIYN